MVFHRLADDFATNPQWASDLTQRHALQAGSIGTVVCRFSRERARGTAALLVAFSPKNSGRTVIGYVLETDVDIV